MFLWPVFLAVKTEGGFRFDTRSGHASIDSQRGNHVLLECNVEKIRYPKQNVRSLDGGGGSFEIQEKWGKVEGSVGLQPMEFVTLVPTCLSNIIRSQVPVLGVRSMD